METGTKRTGSMGRFRCEQGWPWAKDGRGRGRPHGGRPGARQRPGTGTAGSVDGLGRAHEQSLAGTAGDREGRVCARERPGPGTTTASAGGRGRGRERPKAGESQLQHSDGGYPYGCGGSAF